MNNEKEMQLLRLAIQAGAYAIENNKRLIGADYTIGTDSMSFYKANIMLRVLSSHVDNDKIDINSLCEELKSVDKYTLVR